MSAPTCSDPAYDVPEFDILRPDEFDTTVPTEFESPQILLQCGCQPRGSEAKAPTCNFHIQTPNCAQDAQDLVFNYCCGEIATPTASTSFAIG